MKLHDLTAIRRQNLVKVLDLMTLSPALTRQELAVAAGLSQMTVTNLVDLLKKQGVLQMQPIQREDNERPMHGRRAEAISLSGAKKAWLIVDISNRQFSMTLMGFDMALLLTLNDGQCGEYLPRLEHFLQESRQQVLAVLGDRELLGVAVVTPGPYDLASDTVNNQRLPQLNGVKIKELFCRCFGAYDYYVDEDVKFAVRSFNNLTVSSQCEVLYYLYIGEGVGGAAVQGGNMLRGLNATAGDAGHLIGKGGVNFESRLSTEAYTRLAAQTSPVAALAEMAAITAQMLHAVLWLLDPTHIIIDCVYATPCGDAFVAAVEEQLRLLFQGESRILPRMTASNPGISSVLRGAVCVLQRAWLERILA